MHRIFDNNTRSYHNERIKQEYYDPNLGVDVKRDYMVKNRDGKVDVKVDERIKQYHNDSYLRNDNIKDNTYLRNDNIRDNTYLRNDNIKDNSYNQSYSTNVDRNLTHGDYGAPNYRGSNFYERDRNIDVNQKTYNRGDDVYRSNYNTDYDRGQVRTTNYDNGYNSSYYRGHDKRGITDKVKDFFGMGHKDHNRNYEEHIIENKYYGDNRNDHDVRAYNQGYGQSNNRYNPSSRY